MKKLLIADYYYYFKAQVTATQNHQNPTDPGINLPEN